MFSLDPQNLAAIVLRTVVVYVVVVLGLRLLGKRELGQMTVFDFVLLLTLSNAVQNAMTGGDNSLDGGLLSALTLLLMDRLFSFLGLRNPLFHRLLIGEPTLLIHDGQFLWGHMRKEGITEDELMQTLREHSLEDASKVRSAILEVDGTISIVPIETAEPIHAHRRRFARRPGRST